LFRMDTEGTIFTPAKSLGRDDDVAGFSRLAQLLDNRGAEAGRIHEHQPGAADFCRVLLRFWVERLRPPFDGVEPRIDTPMQRALQCSTRGPSRDETFDNA